MDDVFLAQVLATILANQSCIMLAMASSHPDKETAELLREAVATTSHTLGRAEPAKSAS